MTDIIKNSIPHIPNWPSDGVVYRDITGLVSNPEAFKLSVDSIASYMLQSNIDCILAPDARGFIWGAPVAYKLDKPLHLIRKPGKLPPPTYEYFFDYEYASTSLNIKATADINSNTRVGVIDDVNATGGTALAVAKLLEKFGTPASNIYYASVVNLPFLGGSTKIQQEGINFYSVIEYNE